MCVCVSVSHCDVVSCGSARVYQRPWQLVSSCSGKLFESPLQCSLCELLVFTISWKSPIMTGKSSPGFVTLWARFKAGTPLSSWRETHASKKVRMVDVKKNRMQWLAYCLLPIFNWKQHMSRNAFVSLSTTVNRHRDELVVHTLQNSNAWILSPFYYFEFDTSNQKVVSEQIFLTLLLR